MSRISGAVGVVFIFGALWLPAAAHAQELRPNRLAARKGAAMSAPQGVTASSTREGVQLTWQPVAEAVQYLVLRGPDASTTGSQIGETAAGAPTFLDRGFNQPAAYQVIAVAADGRRGASAFAQYTPPAKMVTGPAATTITPVAIAPVIGKKLGPLSTRTLATTTPPVIQTVGQNVHNGLFMYNGDTVKVTGAGLDGMSGVYLAAAYCNPYGCQINPNAGAPQPVTPHQVSAGSFSFVPQVPAPYLNQLYPYFLIVTKGAAADTSNSKLDIGAARPVKKITGVKQAVVRSGLRIELSGLGFDQVDGAYFGTGTPGSQSNPLYSIANRSSTSIQIMTTATCNQYGILMLRETPTGQGSDVLITGDTVIRVGCAAGTPLGYIAGTESSANHQISVMPGSTILIKGTNLRWVTRVLDQRNTAHPFTFSPGFQSVPDHLTVTMPGPQPGRALHYGFLLENSLTDPVVAGTVSGTAMVMAAPSWYRITPAWAEPGQLVHINGYDLSFGATPQVTVGGVPAQVTQAAQMSLSFRLGAGTTTGPISVRNEVGATELTGPFTSNIGSNHPGFFVVSGPSSVTEIVQPRPALAYGDTLTVKGQNLARLNGICVASSGQGGAPAGYLKLRRVPIGAGLGYEMSNTEMRVHMDWQPYSVAPGAVQLYAPSSPPGDLAPSQFACAANPAGIQWP